MVAYATREQVMGSLEIRNMARARTLIDNKLEAGARAVERVVQGRRFYPERKTIKFDWPNYQNAASWQLQLDGNDLISLEAVTAGGIALNVGTDVIPRRYDDIDETPYSLIEINLSSNASFAAGPTFQRSLSFTGLWGHNDIDTSIVHGLLSGNINNSVTSLIINPSSGTYPLGVGALVQIGTERLILTSRFMTDTGQNLQSPMTANNAMKTVAVTDGTAFAIEETILIDSERMRIEDIAGNNLLVSRAIDGTVIAAHASPTADIFALRQFTARRGVLGSTAASHTSADSVYMWQPPALVNELNIAETVVMLEQNSSGYARMVGSGDNARETVGKGLEDLRCSVYDQFGRKLRTRAV
jgi:hypothetical protein